MSIFRRKVEESHRDTVEAKKDSFYRVQVRQLGFPEDEDWVPFSLSIYFILVGHLCYWA